MRAVVFRGLGRPLVVEEVPDPTPGPTDLLLRVRGCGICGSDLHAAQTPPGLLVPCVMGHAVAGDVVELGSEAMITEVVGLDAFPDAFEELKQPTTQSKVILEP